MPSARWLMVGLACTVMHCGGGDFTTFGDGVVVCARGTTLEGIDVSYWQGTINWPMVAAAGIRFAIVRVSDGSFQDTQFDRNWAEARRNGIVRGVYQYFRPGQDPIAQADLLLRRMGPLMPGDLAPVIDVEATDGRTPTEISARVRQWVDRVRAATGRDPIIYTGLYFWRDNVRSTAFASNPLWIAQYGPMCPDIPAPWTTWAMHQYTSMGRVAGISGNVDRNRFNGTIEDLRRLGGILPGDGGVDGGVDAGADSAMSDVAPADVSVRDAGAPDSVSDVGLTDGGTNDDAAGDADAPPNDSSQGDARSDARSTDGGTGMVPPGCGCRTFGGRSRNESRALSIAAIVAAVAIRAPRRRRREQRGS